MTKMPAANNAATIDKSQPNTKSQLVIGALSRAGGATLEELSAIAGWLPHSTRSFTTSLKKKGHVIENAKVDGIRRYRIVPKGAA